MFRKSILFVLGALFLLVAGSYAQDDAPLDVPYNTKVVTPHVKWANPYNKGKLKIFMVFGFTENRAVIEVAQRLSCEFATVTLVNGEEPIKWGLGGEGIYDKRTSEDILNGVSQKIRHGGYDVIILGGGSYKDYFKNVEKDINDQVKKGTGLVQFNMQRLTPKTSEILPMGRMYSRIGGQKWDIMDPSSFIINGIPVSQMKSDLVQYIGVNEKVNAKIVVKAGVDAKDNSPNPLLVTGQYGEGRLVGISGQDSSEAGWAMFIKAIVWAAKKENDTLITDISTDSKTYDVNELTKGKLKVSFKAGKEAVASADLYIDTDLITTQKVSGSSISFSLPPCNAGRRIGSVILKDAEGKSINWASTIFSVKTETEIGEVAISNPDHKYLQEPLIPFGGEVSGKTSVKLAAGLKAYTELWDNFGRCLDRREGAGSFKFKTNNFLRQRGFIKLRVYDAAGNFVMESSAKFLVALSPENRKWDDYEVMVLGGGATPERTKALADVTDPWMHGGAGPMGGYFDYNLRPYPIGIIPNGIQEVSRGAWDQIVNKFKAAKDKKKQLIRKPCINNASFPGLVDELAGKIGKTFGALGTICYINGDEQSYTHYGSEYDYCFSDECMKEFRKWLKTQYPSIAALNAEWKSSFSSFDVVEPPLVGDVRADMKKVAGWSDHRMFNNLTYKKGLSMTLDKIRESDKDAIFGLSGTQGPQAYGGHDWEGLMDVIGANMSYWGGGGNSPVEMSFNPKCKDAPWTGYGSSVNGMRQFMWDSMFHGATGISYYDALTAIRPDLNPCPSYGEVGNVLKYIRDRGLAKMLINAEKKNDGIAIYYSQPSINAAHIYGLKYGSDWGELTDVLNSAGWTFRVVSANTIKDGGLAKNGYKLLFLASIHAMSKAEAEEIKAFVQGGGVVFATGNPAKYNEHCNKYDKGLLDDLMDKSSSDIFSAKKVGKGYFFWQADTFEKLNKKGYYLHKDWIAYFNSFYTEVGSKAGITPVAKVADLTGKTLYRTDISRLDSGDMKYVGLVAQENGVTDKVRKYKVTLDKTYNVYNSKLGKFIGNVSSFMDELPQADAVLYALLPYQVTAVNVTAAGKAKTGTVVPVAISVTAKDAKTIGDHIVHVNVYDPEGKMLKPVSKNIITKAGAATYSLMLPYNFKPGTWKVEVLDAATGVTGTASVVAE